MIISHSHRFIFIKSLKTAGTSLEAALSNQCSGRDVVVPINDFGHNRDEKGQVPHRSMNADEVYRRIGQHVDAPTIKSREPAEVWNGYFKFSIARNPWDRALSYFFWDHRRDASLAPPRRFYHRLGVPYDDFGPVKRKFAEFIKSRTLENNDRFYVIDDTLCVDFVIRYERLEEDSREVCARIGLSSLEIPRLKTGIRKKERPYTDYYDGVTRDIVAELHRNDIRLFDYRFGK
jgi:hypothetical protein